MTALPATHTAKRFGTASMRPTRNYASLLPVDAVPVQPSQRVRRIALYSHDTMGLGHKRRNLLLAQTLAAANPDADILLIVGAHEGTPTKLTTNIDFLTLPALHKDGDGQYQARRFNLGIQEMISLRASTIKAALSAFVPDVFIVDNVPRGALRELDPVLAELRARGRTRCVLGLREILDEADVVQREWSRAENETAIRTLFDVVWVYGDPTVYDMVREYRFAPDIAEKIRYTGYLDQRMRLAFASPELADPLAALDLPDGRLALCMVGGGQDGAQLTTAFAQATLPDDMHALVVAGPYMPQLALEQIQRSVAANPRMHLLPHLPEPTLMLDRVDRVVSMGGYNTVCELLSFEKRALIVPRIQPRREQLIRAERLRDLHLTDLLLPSDVSPTTISRWLARDLAAPRTRDRIDMHGLHRIVHLLDELFAPATPAQRQSEQRHIESGRIAHARA